jgi:hypothetical protein
MTETWLYCSSPRGKNARDGFQLKAKDIKKQLSKNTKCIPYHLIISFSNVYINNDRDRGFW